MKRIALFAVLGLLVAAAVAVARTAPEHHPTALGIERVEVSADGAITVTGTIDSDIRRCELRVVVLKRAGGSGFLDLGFTSFRGHVWSLRSKPGVADGIRDRRRGPSGPARCVLRPGACTTGEGATRAPVILPGSSARRRSTQVGPRSGPAFRCQTCRTVAPSRLDRPSSTSR